MNLYSFFFRFLSPILDILKILMEAMSFLHATSFNQPVALFEYVTDKICMM